MFLTNLYIVIFMNVIGMPYTKITFLFFAPARMDVQSDDSTHSLTPGDERELPTRDEISGSNQPELSSGTSPPSNANTFDNAAGDPTPSANAKVIRRKVEKLFRPFENDYSKTVIGEGVGELDETSQGEVSAAVSVAGLTAVQTSRQTAGAISGLTAVPSSSLTAGVTVVSTGGSAGTTPEIFYQGKEMTSLMCHHACLCCARRCQAQASEDVTALPGESRLTGSLRDYSHQGLRSSPTGFQNSFAQHGTTSSPSLSDDINTHRLKSSDIPRHTTDKNDNLLNNISRNCGNNYFLVNRDSQDYSSYFSPGNETGLDNDRLDCGMSAFKEKPQSPTTGIFRSSNGVSRCSTEFSRSSNHDTQQGNNLRASDEKGKSSDDVQVVSCAGKNDDSNHAEGDDDSYVSDVDSEGYGFGSGTHVYKDARSKKAKRNRLF